MITIPNTGAPKVLTHTADNSAEKPPTSVDTVQPPLPSMGTAQVLSRTVAHSPATPRTVVDAVEVPAALAGDIRIIISLLLAKEAKESLGPLNELAGKLQQLGQQRADIRAAKSALTGAMVADEEGQSSAGEAEVLSLAEIEAAIEKGRALGVDVSVLEGVKNEERQANHVTGDGYVYLQSSKEGAAFNQDRGALKEKILDSYDEALEAKRDATTEINFRIQMAMQHHTSSMATASQIISETKRQDESVRIA